MLRRLTLASLLALAIAPAAHAQDSEQIPSAAARACDMACTVEKVRSGELTYRTVVAGARPRAYRLYVPANLPADAPVPLVVALHGGLGNGHNFSNANGFDALARDEGFVVAYGEGDGATWDAGHCCGIAGTTWRQDIAYIEAVVADIRALRPIEERRIFLTGHSNGAMMTHRMACESALFAAVAAVAGAYGGPCEAPGAPLSVLHIHGTADANVPYEGGNGAAGPDQISVHPAIEDVMAAWRARNACPAVTESRDDTVVTLASAPCAASTEVTTMLIEGGGHAWPGSSPGRANASGAPSQAMDATLVIWDFFERHPRP
jgi:polyhydroxybutyrate depolymerase